MKIKCEECGFEEWTIKIHKVRGRGLNGIYTALQCESCRMIYPLSTIYPTSNKKDTVEIFKDYLRESTEN